MPRYVTVESDYQSGGRKKSSGQGSNASSSRSTCCESARPKLWRCCKCSGGWFSTQLNDSCPMCQSWRCDNCEYSMS